MKDSFDTALEYFNSIEQELVEKYRDKFVVVKDCTIHGVYDTEGEAYLESCKKFEEGSFLIRQCLQDRKPVVFHSRAYL